MLKCNSKWRLFIAASILFHCVVDSARAQAPAKATAALDANLFTTYSLFNGQTVALTVCGSTQESEGCFGSASLGPFGRPGAILESNPYTRGDVVTRYIYIVDVAAGSASNGVELYVYKKTDTITSSTDTVSVTLAHTISLSSLIGGTSANCFMVANGTYLFLGTDQGPNVITVNKGTLAVNVAAGQFEPNITAITSDGYGFVTVTWGNSVFGVFDPAAEGVEGGGGADFTVNTVSAVSTASLLSTDAHGAVRPLVVHPKAPQGQPK